MTTMSWEDLVTSALLGTDRRPLPPMARTRPGGAGATAPRGPRQGGATAEGTGALDAGAEDTGDGHAGAVDARTEGTGKEGTRRQGTGSGSTGQPLDAPLALLGAAAVHTVRRRAGLVPAVAAPLPPPAPGDARPPLPEAAARRLAQLLADRPSAGGGGGRRGAAPDLTELLPQWLAAADAYGYRAPAAALPALLDAARSRTDLRPRALAFGGPRALWLAGFNPEWRFALRGAPGGTALPAPEDARGVRRLWEEGLFAERVALLEAVRAHDPAAALELLASTWAKERAEDRLMFLDSLRTGLSPADEEFLEGALSDRSRNVRSAAAELLSALPGSAYAERMAARAASCVGLDHTAGRPTVAVEAPHECDAAMQRDGVVPQPPAGRGKRSWWLGQLVEATPLAVWGERLGGRTPEEVVALPVADDWRDELHAAWCRAAVRQRDAAWSRVLLGPASAPPSAGPGAASSAALLSTLPDGERAEWVAAFVASHGLSEAFQLLGVCTVPWSGALGRAVVDALDIAREAGGYPWSFSGVMGLAERCLDPGEADRLESMTAAPDEGGDSAPGAGGYWAEAFQRLVATLRLRAAMHEELAGRTG
ncbi:DUF5691 domain-containing protein [Streptomyces fradiae]|uniref:DUF5691 domain-containing protein n=1 Tax=Streptomyces fradiae TaxID=1906 RepID=UPI0029423579|nr:DUF5691 domain-containing protein [Streptomyces fradiae]WOI62855.1 DUF5691 domain-containing protein [Streptomyces fradiae]